MILLGHSLLVMTAKDLGVAAESKSQDYCKLFLIFTRNLLNLGT